MPVAYGLVQGVDLSLPRVPARLVGARIAHLSDLHLSPRLPSRRRFDRIAAQLSALRLDLLVLTGDYMTREGDEAVALDVLRRIVDRVRPRFGIVGVFGNHDSEAFIEEARTLPVTWLRNSVHRIDALSLECRGLDWPGDAVTLAMAIDDDAPASGEPWFKMGLSHSPTALATMADLGVDLLLCGHTHGGQIRLPTGLALRNSMDQPLHLTSGIFRHRDTLCVVSRGVGEIGIPLRLFCPPHIPLYTLRRGAMPGQPTDTILRIQAW